MNSTQIVLNESQELVLKTRKIEKEINERNLQYKSNMKKLNSHRKFLVQQLNERLELKRKDRDGTLLDFYNESFEFEQIHGKNLFEDFLYLYKDSRNQYRSVYPIEFYTYKINNRDDLSERGDASVYVFNESDDDYSTKIVDANMDEKNWKLEFVSPEIFTLANEEKSRTIVSLIYMNNLRKLTQTRNHKFDLQDISVFIRSEHDWLEEFRIRDRIVEIIKLNTRE